MSDLGEWENLIYKFKSKTNRLQICVQFPLLCVLLPADDGVTNDQVLRHPGNVSQDGERDQELDGIVDNVSKILKK